MTRSVVMGALLGWTLALGAGCSSPGNECQAGSAEVPGNGIDDDCDGLTDECSLDADCQDRDPCTQDLCQGGHCKNPAVEEGTSCDDGDRCTAADACRAGQCLGKPRDCSVLDESCRVGQCDPAQGLCQKAARPDGLACEDGMFCTTGDTCQAGTCSGAGLSCDDHDDCTQDSCSEATQACAHTLAPRPGAEGPAGDATCTNDRDDDCDGLIDLDDPDCAWCASDPECDDLNPCTQDSCQGAVCHNTPFPDGLVCDDGNWCTLEDACLAGACQGTLMDCSTPPVACTLGFCADLDKKCQTLPRPNGFPCDDDQVCTTGDVCQNMVCVGPPAPDGTLCDDGDPSTPVDTCIAGACVGA